MSSFAYTGSNAEKILATSRINQVFWDGYDAERRGFNLTDCPHEASAATHKAWHNGWHKSRQERRQ